MILCMRMGVVIIIVGIVIFLMGLGMYYSIETGETDSLLRFIKNAGTFTGLVGIGATLAGIMLYLFNRNEPPIQEDKFDI